MKIIVLAAHADDETLGPAGTLRRHVDAGDEVTVYIAADCRAARADVVPSLLPAAERAACVLGVRLHFLGFAGMTLADRQRDLTRKVERAVADERPDVIYTHHVGDLNTDHRAVAEAVAVAARPGGSVRRVLAFETPSSTEWNPHASFTPSYFVDITNTLHEKLAALACYVEELRDPPHPRHPASIKARAAYWGQVAGVLYAEPFVLLREVVE